MVCSSKPRVFAGVSLNGLRLGRLQGHQLSIPELPTSGTYANCKGKFIFGDVAYNGTEPLTLVLVGTNTSKTSSSFSGSVTAVPEPETFAMLLSGLGLIGMIGRCRSIAAANA